MCVFFFCVIYVYAYMQCNCCKPKCSKLTIKTQNKLSLSTVHVQRSQMLCLAGHIPGHTLKRATMLGVQPIYAQHAGPCVRTNHSETVLAGHNRHGIQRPEDVERQIAACYAARDAGHLADVGWLIAEFERSDLGWDCWDVDLDL